ncbi:MAG: winged helix-turn-helix transcriptional regulator [Coriobacteriales bacterium]|nr:winged helix-turn-helix transcriptional regulator [Coriobacteriales bacterium]
MNENQFDVLHCLLRHGGLNQRRIAERCNISLGSVNQALRSLRDQGLVQEDGTVTPKGVCALEPYRVRNAVIMAAGLSSRVAPISYERPKGVLKVRGEVLIERQIRQLQEAGIHDITVVVGYRKEEFFYLEDALGVKIVMNDDYASRNNNSTIKKVEDILGNTYVCSSDNYFMENPFSDYVYDAYYASVFQEGPTDELCFTTRGRNETIVGAEYGGADAWIALGHTYWDKPFASRFCELLDSIYDNAATAGKLWEDIWIEHLDELPMRIRKYPADVIWEFDSLDELRSFDPYFIENVDSSILDNICAVLDCRREDISHFVPVKQGLTNLSVRFQVGGVSYVYRHPGVGTEKIISRESEAFSQGVAKELGIDRTFVYEDATTGWKISRFIEGCVPFDYHNKEHVAAAMEIARKLHTSGVTSPWTFDVYHNTTEIIDLLGKVVFGDFELLLARATRLNDFVRADAVAPVLCHNDFYEPNFLVHERGIDLIDWEYSAMSDYASDLGTFVCCSDYDIPQTERVIAEYFQHEPTREELRHCMAYVALCAFYWFVWALYKDKTGHPVGEWLHLWYRAAKSFGAYALELYEG